MSFQKKVLCVVFSCCIFLSLSTVSGQATYNCANIQDIPVSECEILVEFYNELDGPAWGVSTDRLSSANAGDRAGITVSGGNVRAIDSPEENLLSGALLPSLSGLVELRSFTSEQNENLRGQLPSSWSSLTQLRTLWLPWGEIAWNLPASRSGMTNLMTLDLGWNNLSGDLPGSWSSLSKIESIKLLYNNFWSGIPWSRSGLGNLEILHLNGNNLSWNLPDFLSSLNNLEDLRLNRNQFRGELPLSRSGLVNLQFLYLDDNNLEGWLPDVWSVLTALETLDLQNNNFTWILPNSWSGLVSLRHLDLENNALTWVFPTAWADGMNGIDEPEAIRLSWNSVREPNTPTTVQQSWIDEHVLGLLPSQSQSHNQPEDGWSEPEDGWSEPEDGWSEPEDGWSEPEDGWSEPEDGGDTVQDPSPRRSSSPTLWSRSRDRVGRFKSHHNRTSFSKPVRNAGQKIDEKLDEMGEWQQRAYVLWLIEVTEYVQKMPWIPWDLVQLLFELRGILLDLVAN